MDQRFIRTEKLLGSEAVQKLYKSRVMIFGAGGVGGYVIEALARSGVGEIAVTDGDIIALSNINRQILATEKTIGKNKAETAAERIKEINPYCKITSLPLNYTAKTAGLFDFKKYDYIVDAIDSVTDKLNIIERAKRENVAIISCMGAGNKLDPSAFKVADISKTSVCPLARVIRRELKKRGIENLKTVYSEEPPVTYAQHAEEENAKKIPPASCAFVPSAAGLLIAAEVIKDLAKN